MGQTELITEFEKPAHSLLKKAHIIKINLDITLFYQLPAAAFISNYILSFYYFLLRKIIQPVPEKKHPFLQKI